MITRGEAENWDAVVVGAGFGGLVCAAYLAVSGHKVVVFEHHDVAGGNGHTFRRRRAYEFDVGVHYLGDCAPGGLIPGILSGLGLSERVRFLEMDPNGFDRIQLPTVTVDVPAGWDRYRERLVAALPADAHGIETYVRIAREVCDLQRSGLLRSEGLGQLSRESLELMVMARGSLAALFDHCGLSTRARTVLAGQSANYGAAPDQVTVSTHLSMIDHYLRGAYYPEGGGQALVAALVEVIEAHGGSLRTRKKVERITIEDGRTTGVELAGGERHTAPLVVSNADFRRTVLELAGGERNFPAALVRKTEKTRMRLAFAVLYVALDIELPDRPNANLWWFRDEDIESMYRELAAGTPSQIRSAFCSFASVKEQGRADVCPPGHSNFQVMTLARADYPDWGVAGGPADGTRYRREPAYQRSKQWWSDELLRTAEQALGPFRDHITHLELGTPLTHERYTLSSGGTPYGLAHWGGFGARPDTRTVVDGLYLVGQNTRAGSGVSGAMIGGISCAAQILGRPLLPEVLGGAVLANPALLPERAADWDPLAVSRGTRRVRAKGLARVG
ncbi:phytoene desaturase family protein [Kutzneria sp. NPDC052558]|uniref:phytoene desaturase family protein n=1 Tax=Kutzneria sp. NPDC052558 TaxID=3364121 RepID=UPI0037C65100